MQEFEVKYYFCFVTCLSLRLYVCVQESGKGEGGESVEELFLSYKPSSYLLT